MAGPIIRITPTELHIDDPDYYEQLYSRASRRDKYSYFSGRFGYASDSFSTTNHDLHRLRRKPLNPMFSIKRISEFQPVIRDKVGKLCQKISLYQDGQVLPLSRAWMALTTDIITEYAFAKSYDQLDSPNFQDTLHEALVAIYTTGHFALHFPMLFPILDSLPDWLVIKAQPALLPVVGLRKVRLQYSFPCLSYAGFTDHRDYRIWRDRWERYEKASMKLIRPSSTPPFSMNCLTATFQQRKNQMLV